jgi:selenocysteine-specific elongation factor
MCTWARPTTAHVVPLQDERLEPGPRPGAAGADEAPVFALPGDRLILRNAQASRTIAGGLVLDPFAPERRAAVPSAGLPARAGGLDGQGDVGALLASAPQGLARAGWPPAGPRAWPDALPPRPVACRWRATRPG